MAPAASSSRTCASMGGTRPFRECTRRVWEFSASAPDTRRTHRVPRSCGAVPEGHVARRIALGASRGTWRKLQEHLLQVWRHQRFADRLEAVLPAPELDADRKSTRLNSSH